MATAGAYVRLNEAYQAAQQELADGNLGGYQSQIARMADLVERALAQTRGTGNANDATPPTTTAPPG